MPRGYGVIAAIVCVLGVAIDVRLPAAQHAPPAIAELLDRYSRHDFEAPIALAKIFGKDAEEVEAAIEAQGAAWIGARGSGEAPARRMIAATFVLDLARVWSVTPYDLHRWRSNRRVLAWGCTQLRRNPKPLEGERWWHLGVVALLESRQDVAALIGNDVPPPPLSNEPLIDGPRGHLLHALARFPAEPRFKLAQVVSKEMATWRVGLMSRPGAVGLSRNTATSSEGEDALPRIGALPPEITADYVAELTSAARPWLGARDPRSKFDVNRAAAELAQIEVLRASLREFETLFSVDAVAADAHLRYGYSSLRLGDRAGGLDHLVRAESLSTDPVLLYLSRVYTGSAYEALDRPGDAIAAYRRALEGAPIARTAGLALTSLLMRESRVADANDIAEQLLSHPDAADPISRYRTGDYRFLFDFLEQLKKALP